MWYVVARAVTTTVSEQVWFPSKWVAKWRLILLCLLSAFSTHKQYQIATNNKGTVIVSSSFCVCENRELLIVRRLFSSDCLYQCWVTNVLNWLSPTLCRCWVTKVLLSAGHNEIGKHTPRRSAICVTWKGSFVCHFHQDYWPSHPMILHSQDLQGLFALLWGEAYVFVLIIVLVAETRRSVRYHGHTRNRVPQCEI